WGILGWICLLVITIAYEVVPMFQLTPAYPAILQRWLSLSIFSGLLTLSAGKLSGLDFITLTGSILLGISLGVFAIITVWLQSKRKKKQFNITVWFWFFAMLCLLTAIVLWLSAQFIHELNNNPTYPLILGSLMIFGFSVSVINGMLYKIIPFLSWVHLSITVTQLNVSRRQIPNIKSFIQHQPTFIQFGLHLSSVLLIIACIIKPTIFISLAALSFALSNALLWWNLYSGYRIYKKAEMEIIFAEKNRINN
ncbi:MAG: hypothetical protein OEY89_11610, partial [Gammaproteobacteria bacterium]|nr:hypothetical protein [Gammaproteobacteria bacterium]